MVVLSYRAKSCVHCYSLPASPLPLLKSSCYTTANEALKVNTLYHTHYERHDQLDKLYLDGMTDGWTDHYLYAPAHFLCKGEEQKPVRVTRLSHNLRASVHFAAVLTITVLTG